MSVSAFDHPWLAGLLGDELVVRQFAPEAELAAMLAFELALAQAEAAEGAIPKAAAATIADRVKLFTPDTPALATATARDGVVVPELVRQLRAFVGEAGRHVHFGATSQDVIDTSLVLRLKPLMDEFEARLRALEVALDALSGGFGAVELMGRTRMQDALPIRAGQRIAAWRGPLARHIERLEALMPRLLVLQFGGAVGTLDTLGDKGPAVAVRLAEALRLGLPPMSWHSQRDNLAELGDWLALVSGSLGKIGADVALMAQMGEIGLAGGGGSSAMPHKSNPVAAETLVALAQFNASLVGGMHRAQVHEQERSGAAWTLEWLILPQMLTVMAAGLRAALGLVANVTRIGAA